MLQALTQIWSRLNNQELYTARNKRPSMSYSLQSIKLGVVSNGKEQEINCKNRQQSTKELDNTLYNLHTGYGHAFSLAAKDRNHTSVAHLPHGLLLKHQSKRL